jgi:uncharacterized protein involved in response to NO
MIPQAQGSWFRVRFLHEPFIAAALLIALTAGFGYGAVLVGTLAYGIVPGAWYSALVQAHGHAQLFGWVGLFVLGMGLYFLPRLRGTSLRETGRLAPAFVLFVGGIALRTIAQPLSGWVVEGKELWRTLVLVSALLELAGMGLILSTLAATERAEKPLSSGAPAYPVEPLARLGFFSFALAVLVNLAGAWNALIEAQSVLAPRYDQVVITLILYGTALPMTIVFGVRNLPLFLRLAQPPRAIWRTLTLYYAFGVCLLLIPNVLAIADDALALTGHLLRANYLVVLVFDALAPVGAVLVDFCILAYVWQLDLARRRPPWTANRAPNTRPDLDPLRKPARPAYPDYGEYGRFELLIYSAFVWLVIAALLDLARILGTTTAWFNVPQDIARHALMVGYLSLLIFGIAARMAPGFSGKRRLAYPGLVVWLFVLGNLAALLRVVPALFPESTLALSLWGLSGIVGWVAVLCLAVNLLATFRRT